MYLDLASIPWNMVAWSYGSIAILLFARRNYKLSKMSNNSLHEQFAQFMTAIGVALAVFALPGILVHDPQILRITIAIGDSLIVLAFILNFRLMYTLRLLNRSALLATNALTAVLSLVVFYLGVTSNQIVVENYLLYHQMHQVSSLIFTGIFAGALLPVGYFFFKKGLQNLHIKQGTHSFMLGFTYLAVAIVSIFNYGLRGGQQDLIATTVVLASFSALLIISLVPIRQHTLEHSPMKDKRPLQSPEQANMRG